jgi:ribosomal protein L37AE/L43A
MKPLRKLTPLRKLEPLRKLGGESTEPSVDSGPLNPCPRCGGSVLPVEYVDAPLWRCSSCTRTFGGQLVENFTEEDVKQDHRAGKHIMRRYC